MPDQHVVVHCGVNTLRLLPRKKQRTKLFREPRIESEKNVIKNVISAISCLVDPKKGCCEIIFIWTRPVANALYRPGRTSRWLSWQFSSYPYKCHIFLSHIFFKIIDKNINRNEHTRKLGEK